MATDSGTLLALLARQSQVAPIPAPKFEMNNPFATLAGFGNSFSAQAAQDTNQMQNQLLMQRVRELVGQQSQNDNLDMLRKLIQHVGPEAAASITKQVLSGVGAGGGEAVDTDLANDRTAIELEQLKGTGDAASSLGEAGLEGRQAAQDAAGTNLKEIVPRGLQRALAAANTTTTTREVSETPDGKPFASKSKVVKKTPTIAEGAGGLPGQTQPLAPQGRRRKIVLPSGKIVHVIEEQ